MGGQEELTLTANVYPGEPDEGGYWAEVLELPGCVAQGEDLDELRRNLSEAVIMCLEAHYEDEGRHAPKKLFTWTFPVRPDANNNLIPAV